MDSLAKSIFSTILLYRSLYIDWEQRLGHMKAMSLLKTNHDAIQKFNRASIDIGRVAFEKSGMAAGIADGLRSLVNDLATDSTNQYETRNTFDSLKQLIIMADPKFYYSK